MNSLSYEGLDPLLAKMLSEAEYTITQLKIENQSLKEVIVELQKELDNDK